MMDILVVQTYSALRIKLILAEVFNTPPERIIVLDIDTFSSLSEELDGSSIDCLCVSYSVCGSVSQMLQLYRYKNDDLELLNKFAEVAFREKFQCYVPFDSYGGWLYLGENSEPAKVQSIECEDENCYCFRSV